jgi:hypothetical protein
VLAVTGGDPDSPLHDQRPVIPRLPKVPRSSTTPVFSAGGAESWDGKILANVDGFNTRYNSLAQVNAGIGFGPIPISPESR